jgi:hypothetical protein
LIRADFSRCLLLLLRWLMLMLFYATLIISPFFTPLSMPLRHYATLIIAAAPLISIRFHFRFSLTLISHY